MKPLLISALLLLYVMKLPAQVSEDFSDGDFSSQPTWTGNTSLFVVENFKLKSNSSVPNAGFYLSTPSSLRVGAVWEFFLNLQFNTSSSNYVDVYLIADNPNLPNAQNGYFVRIGDTADDICLYRKTAGYSIKIIDGLDGRTNKSDNLLKIKVIRNNAGNSWTLFYDAGGTGSNYLIEGTSADAIPINSVAFGILIQQSTLSFFYKHYLDDIRVYQDKTAPLLSSVKVISEKALDLLFNEPLENTSAQLISNYSLDKNIGSPILAQRDSQNPALVHLSFATALADLETYILSCNGVKDLTDNVLSNASLSFTYNAPYTPKYRDIVINEIMADPTNSKGTIGLPDAEFVELHNPGKRSINIGGWTLEGAGSVSFPFYQIPAGGFVLLCNAVDTAKFSGKALPWGSGTLTNTGEELILRDASAAIIDRIAYDDGMYRSSQKKEGGWTLEQINPLFPCSSTDNWKASINPNGGTPTLVNSVYDNRPDVIPPQLKYVELITEYKITLFFSETIDQASLNNKNNYTLSGNIVINSVKPSDDLRSVELLLASPLQKGLIYQIQANNLKDCSGNVIGAGNSLKVGIGSDPVFSELLITELLADESPSNGLPEHEFLELYNRGSRVLELENCVLDDGSKRVFPKSLVFPGEYVIICSASYVSEFEQYGKVIPLSGLSLLNSGELLVFKNKSGGIVHSLRYSDTWYGNSAKKNGGWTLEMIDPGNPCGEDGNWLPSTNPKGGTPASLNAVNAQKPDRDKPFVKEVVAIHQDTLLVIFNEKMDSSSLKRANFQISPSLQVKEIIAMQPEFKQAALVLSSPLQKNTTYTLALGYCADCSQNSLDADKNKGSTGLPEQADSTDIVLNEVLFNPRINGYDFVEIYNASQKYIDLQNWSLANADAQGNPDTRTKISTEHSILAPGAYRVLTENPLNIQTEYPRSVAENLFQLSSMPSYNDDQGTVLLIDDKKRILQQFDYQDSYHFRLLNNTEGVSLERINPLAPCNNPSNWHSAASTVGYASPGYLNSQFRNSQPVDDLFQIEPKVFTPDGDGNIDFTSIYYHTEKNGYVAGIWIYDKEGRKVRKLAENTLLASEGSFVWDGSNEEGQKAAMGYYLVLIQLSNPAGNEQVIRKTVVLGSRF